MPGRPPTSHLGRSPFEIVAIPLLAVGLGGVGLLWGTGIVVGSILGSTLPGAPGESVFAMLSSFPDIGAAWEPAIPSVLVWVGALIVTSLVAPLIRKLVRMGRLRDEGAQWASAHDLRRAGLLIADRSLTHAAPDSTEVADAS